VDNCYYIFNLLHADSMVVDINVNKINKFNIILILILVIIYYYVTDVHYITNFNDKY